MSRSMYEYLLQPASGDGSSGDFVVTTGGSSSTAEPSANVSISCSDLRDSHCYSQYIITLEGTGGLTPKEACCVCGANYVVGTFHPRIHCANAASLVSLFLILFYFIFFTLLLLLACT